ncbi:RNA-binding protein 5-like isoform X2 [Dendronephthya gigantea]|uniref:RNA-binding protein 5-like isoform X2 n=1 Tax=Dendronephthya gigantea TaxID=151771 RepID=UPI001069ED57|nr:RNA-binding protein 5-like isoform X2 [Dendronephthya gigantea]
MAWSSLPLIEMDDVNMKRNSNEFRDNIRNQNPGDNLEKDISKQLSAFRQQSKVSKDFGQDRPSVDEFGRDVYTKPSSEGEQNFPDRESGRRRERSRSPRRWREDDDRGREWGNEEQRRRNRYACHVDEGEDEGRNGERYRDWSSRGREPDRYRDNYRRDNYRDRDERDYRDHDDRDYRDRDERDYRDRDERDYRDRDDRDYRDRDDRDYRDRDNSDHRERDERDYRDRGQRDYRDLDKRDWRRDKYDERNDERRRDYRDRYRNDDDKYSSERRSHDDRDYDRRVYREEPSEIVMLKGLPTSTEDTQIHEILADAKLPYKDVRVVKTREGFSRGFAFVEFLDMETAKKWIDNCKGKLTIEDTTVIMDFSRSKMAVESHRDWVCSKCGTQNFSSKRRNTCFTCNTPKDENDETKELGSTPCKVLILRGLDILTTEETIRQSLASFTSTPIFDVRLIKDKLTGTSRGFCFVELGSIEEATQLREELQTASFTIDEKVLVISYAKFATNPSKSGTVAVGSSSTSATTSVTATTTSSSSTANKTRSKFAANAIAQARAAAQMGHTTDSQLSTSMDHYSTIEDTSASQQPASSTAQDVTTNAGVSSETPTDPSVDKTAKAGASQTISSYVYDAASGYYYDTTTGLYYDPTTQYYYNSTTKQYMYWDATTQQYVTVVSSAGSSETPATTAADQTQGASEMDSTAASKEKQKKAKSLNAKKIAKDMERWAKKQAKNKEASRPQATALTTQDTVKESTYQYDPNDLKGGINMSITGSTTITPLATASPLAALSELDNPTAPAIPAAAGSLVAEYDGDDSGGDEGNKEDDYTDLTKMACLLCKRQFPTKEALSRHVQLSDLHKQNLLVQKKLKMSFNEIDEYEKEQREAKYRDRARERRELFGQPDSAPPGSKRKKKGKISYEQPTKDGITSDNIGNKMLQAMGWTAGTGLGKDRQGIVDPILAKMRNRTAGLGLKGSDFGATAGDSERDLLKKMAQSRYNDA